MNTLEETSRVLHAPLPQRWGPVQRCKNSVLYVLIRGFVGLVSLIPFAVARRMCVALGLIAGLVVYRERRCALRQLAQAMPELSVGAHRRIVRRMFMHFAESVAELTHLDRFLSGPKSIAFSQEQRALIDEALAEGRGVVVVSGHIGNWELFAHVLAKSGLPVATIAKPLYDPRLTRWVHQVRTATGMQVIWRGDDSASRDMMAVFQEGRMLGLLIDQDTKVQGAFVPFFNQAAHTPTAPAAFAMRFGAPVVLAWMHRRGSTHEIHVERVPLPNTGDRDADIIHLTAALSHGLERAVRECPEQWVWVHRRWKQQPS